MDERGGVDVATAAALLGISKDAVRHRIQRQSVAAYKATDGTWRIIVPAYDADTPPDTTRVLHTDTPDTPLAAMLHSTIAMLHEQLNVKDEQIAAMRTGYERQINELHVLLQTSQRLISASAPDAPQASVSGAEVESHGEPPNVAPVSVQRVERASERSLWHRFVQALRGEIG